MAAGVATALVGPAVPIALTAAAALFVLIARHPVLAAYLYVAALPFVTGIERGTVVPVLRPNELVQVFVTTAVLAGVGARFFARSSRTRVRIGRLDRAIFVLAVLGSVWPLAWLMGRGYDPTTDDVLSALVLWRLFALYALFRYTIRTPEQVRRLLWILLAGACALAAIALLQGRGLVSVSGLLGGDAPRGRGRATLSSSIAVGDYLAYSLALVLGLYLRRRAPARLLGVIGVVLIVGSLATGQFSAWIAALVVLIVVAAHERQLMRLAVRVLPGAALALLLAWPIVDRRLAGFGDGGGAPSSWLGRIDNLTHFYLPQLGGFQWVLGVRPDSVLPAPETWREVIYLESGLLWLLWVGGVPLLIAFVWFLYAAFAHVRALAGSRYDDLGVVALAALGSLSAMAILTIIDMHLTLRGAGDLLFVLLGLTASSWWPAPTRGAASPEPAGLNEEGFA
ncbi:MAG: hypothetical protein ACRDY6_10025 [Acidimicrobiia bacterium]